MGKQGGKRTRVFGSMRTRKQEQWRDNEITRQDVSDYERNCRKIFMTQMYSDDAERRESVYCECASKAYFPNQDATVLHEKLYGQRAYHCPHCHGWHLTSHALHGKFIQQRDWKMAEKEHAEIGLTDQDIADKVWMGIFEDEPIDARIQLASKFACRIDREMNVRISCRRGKRTYGTGDEEDTRKEGVTKVA